MKGNITRRGEHSWRVKYDVPSDRPGERVIRYETVRGKRANAEARLRELLSAVDKGQDVAPSRETLGAFLDRWHRDWAASNLAPMTVERFGQLIEGHVRPHLGSVPLQKLRTAHLAELYAKLGREPRTRVQSDGVTVSAPPLGAVTVGHVHRLLHRALGHAVAWGLIASNPASVAEPPRVEHAEVEILTEDQARDVLQKLRGRTLYLIVALALATGARRGELLALRWSDIDLESGTLRIERSLEKTKAHGLRFKSPKTRHGRRVIAVPPWIIAELRAHWKAQQERRLELGLGKSPDDALVLGNRDGTPRNPTTVSAEWIKFVKRNGLGGVKFHALRHTHASQLIDAGMDVITIGRRLGHASPNVTLGVYGHRFQNKDAQAAQIVEAAFANVERK